MLIYKFVDVNNGECRVIKIKLLDTPFSNRWKDYLIRTADRVGSVNWYCTGINSNTFLMKIKDMREYLEKIIESLNFLKTNIGFEFDTEIIEIIKQPYRLKQRHLNTWHRYFTFLCGKLRNNQLIIPDGVDDDDLYMAIHSINSNVHILEGFTYYGNLTRNKFGRLGQLSIQCHNAHNLNNLNNGVWAEGQVELIEDDTFDFLTDKYHHNVWLHEDIEGKDQMKAWLDGDDLTCSDITGNLIMTPNITIDFPKLYSRIIDDPEFRKQSIECGKKINRPPLGNLVDYDYDLDWEFFLTSTVESITLDEKTLWSCKNW
jgi:hypothetical protein